MQYRSLVFHDGVTAYYRLGTLSGTTSLDETGNNFNLSIHGGVTLGTPGVVSLDASTSMTFDGSTGYLQQDVGTTLSTAGWTAITVEAWVNLSNVSFGQNARVADNAHTDADNSGFQMLINAAGANGNFYVGNGTSAQNAPWGVTFNAGQWYHLVGTYDGSYINTYVNGVFQNSSGGFSGALSAGTAALNIGRGMPYNGDFFPGIMDEIAIYKNIALTADQIAAHYATAFTNHPDTYTVFISNLPYTPIAGTVQIDSTIGRRSSGSIQIHTDANTHFQERQQVAIYDTMNALAFSGYIQTPKEQQPGFQKTLIHSLTLIDQGAYIAGKRRVTASYSGKTVGFIATDIANTILVQEGVSIGQIQDGPTPSTMLFPSTNLFPGGVVIPNAIFVYAKISDALDALVKEASSSGVPYYWLIDQFKKLYIVPYTTTINSNSIDGSQIDDGKLSGFLPTVTRANPLYRNKQTVVGGVTQTLTQTESRKGDGVATTFTMSFALASTPTVKVNGTTKTVGIKGISTGKDWYWAQGDPVIAQDSAGTKLVSTDTFQATYIGQYPSASQTQNDAQIAYIASLDGTSGIVEDVATDATLMNATDGIAEASNLLTLYGQQGTIFEGATLQSGYAPGQLVNVNLPNNDLNGVDMLIESVSMSDQIDGLNYWYQMKLIVGPYDTTWADFFSKLLATSAPANSINIGVAQSVQILQQFTATITLSATFTAVVCACPLPATTLFPNTTLLPC